MRMSDFCALYPTEMPLQARSKKACNLQQRERTVVEMVDISYNYRLK